MNNYEKPIVLANNELSEGVYAASGGTGEGCYSYDGYSGGNQSGNEGYYEYNVRFSHTPDGHYCDHSFIIYFDSAPESATCNTNCDHVEIGTNYIKVVGAQRQANPNENIDFGIKVKWIGNVYGKPTGGYGWTC